MESILIPGTKLRGAMALMVIASFMLAAGMTLAPPAGSLAQTADLEISLSTEISGVAAPMFMAEAPDGTGRMFVVSKHGRIFVASGGDVQDEPFLDIADQVVDEFDESGMFSIAFHPEFADNGIFFVAYSSVDGTNAVARFQVSVDDPNRADPASQQMVLAIPDNVPKYHNGGGLAFGPDGYLYVSVGDDTTEANAQSLLDHHGKILRIDPLTGPIEAGQAAYAVPPDNPFVDRDDALPEIWALGLRNPWRFSFDRETGDLYISDVGQSDWEEINFQPAGSGGGVNYGWSTMEASHCFRPMEGCDPTGLTLPVAEYNHDEGCAVIGGFVYRGSASPSLTGKYLFADICSGNIWGLSRDAAGSWNSELLTTVELTITSFAEDSAGEVYVTTFENGAVRRIAASRPEPVDSPAFEETWARTDAPVANGDVARSWIWGPWETRDIRVEPYDEAPEGWRTVIYLDKARMEITDPNGDMSSPWYVTNGLLVTELITGKLQMGDDLYEIRQPAEVNVAGDAGDPGGPTYASFAGLLGDPPLPFDRPIVQRLNRDGSVSTDERLADYDVQVEWIDTVTTHSIAGPFWEFMNAEGLVLVDGELQAGQLFQDPIFATGRPITEAYWSTVLVGGNPMDVLIQCFERRCLTYTPDSAPEWQVEAGNVGQHYRDWRYGG
ncbi:MAG: PQQ-dependent sugar dehydrogenase [Thermomicrobiales bacterium]